MVETQSSAEEKATKPQSYSSLIVIDNSVSNRLCSVFSATATLYHVYLDYLFEHQIASNFHPCKLKTSKKIFTAPTP